MIPMLLGTLLIAFVVSALGCIIGMNVYPWFRSGERKEGHFRPDQSTGTYHIDARKGLRKLRASRIGASNELPLVGGVAMVFAVVAAVAAVGLWLNFSLPQWQLLAVLMLATIGFGLVGFYDDWRKVHFGEGISELQKLAGVLFVSLLAAVALNRLIVTKHISARLAYPPYTDIPGLGHLLVNAKFAWIAFFLLMTATVTTTTSLAVDFADGMDGLCGGLLVSAALSFAAIILGDGFTDQWPAAVAVLAIAGAAGGFLPFNWPSSWKARNQGHGKRRAKIIMGDTGSLAMGGLLGLVGVITRLEFVLVFIGGVFVLEGLSALISARILVRFYRRFLVLERFGSGRGFAHTEFPLPFLATPMHHHYDLLNFDRKRLVYGAWLLGAGLGVLGVASTIGTFTWERYLARFAALLVIALVWQAGPFTRSFFIGLERRRSEPEDAPRHLALYFGAPFKLFGRPLYGRIDSTSIAEDALDTPSEKLLLWQRMPTFDGRAILGYWCYRASALEDALRIWSRLPKMNLERRPDIAEMLAEVRHTLALQADGGVAVRALESAGADTEAAVPAPDDPNATSPAQTLLQPDDPDVSGWRHAAPSTPSASSPSGWPETPTDSSLRPETSSTPLWSAAAWTAATSGSRAKPKAPQGPSEGIPDE